MDETRRTKTDHRFPEPQAGAAERALAEAEQRRAAAEVHRSPRPPEVDGRQGPEPVRYGDWENKGIACDF